MNIKKILSFILVCMMIVSTVTVSAADKTSDLPFTDVQVNWAYEPIKYVYEHGLMNGTSETTFNPKGSLTRGMVVTVLYRLANSPEEYYDASLFMDVENGRYYSIAACWALNNNIVSGTSTDEWGTPYFSADRSITRQELATMFVRFAEYQHVILSEGGDISSFTDASKVAKWAKKAMEWATAAGLINGTGNGSTLSPTGEATRDQFAAIIQRYCTAEFDYGVFYEEPFNGNSYKAPTFELCDDADVYVAVDGNDKNPGTFEKPLATLEGARDAVRELKKTAKDEIIVAFMAGEYKAPDNTVFTADDAGTAEVPITYRAYGDGDVVFNAGFTVKQNEFVKIDPSEGDRFPAEAVPYIYKVDLSGRIPDETTVHNYLFSDKNGTICRKARDLNMTRSGVNKYYNNVSLLSEVPDSITLTNAAVKIIESLSSTDGLWVRGQFQTGYTYDVYEVKSYDPATHTLTFDIEKFVPLNADYYQNHAVYLGIRRPDGMFFFYNLPEFLDDNGEYWIDPETDVMYIYAPSGSYTYSIGGKHFTLEEGADYISFKGLQFKGSATDSMIGVNSDHITFDGCRFGAYSGRYAIISHLINNFTFERCELYAFPACGIRVHSDADRSNIIPANNVIRNNYLHDFGNPEYWSTGIDLINDVGAIVEHNEFKDACHGGLSFYESIDTVIQYNVFDHLMHSTTDYGAIYTHRGCAYRDNVIRYNLFKNYTNTNQAYGFYNDGSYGQYFYGNLFYGFCGAGYVCNDGRDNVINDNIFVKKTQTGQGGFLVYNPGPYKALTDPGKMVDVNGLIDHMNNRRQPGEEGYELWLSRWPIIYEYNYDMESAGDFNSFYSTINYVNRNKIFKSSDRGPYSCGETYEKFAVAEGNFCYTYSENPYFKNPALGDYTVVTNTDDFENIYDFSKIGVIN